MFSQRLCSRVRWPALIVALAAALAWDGSAGSLSGAQRRPRGAQWAQARQARIRNAQRLLSIQHVVGAATGLARDGRFAVKVYTGRTGAAGIPKELDGVPVVVEATGEFYAMKQPPRPTHRRPPIRRGRWGPPGPRRRPGGQDRPPQVNIVNPNDGDVISGSVTIAAEATDDRGVTVVVFLVDRTPIAVDDDGSDGWSAVWDTAGQRREGVPEFAEGSHTVTAVAADTAGHAASDTIDVTVDNEPGPLSPDGRPAPIGVSTGNQNECSAGTIACRVKDSAGNVYVLSNNHVLARLNQAGLGETIVQPGLFDTRCAVEFSNQAIGSLTDFVPLDFRPQGTNLIDAALALTSIDDLGVATPEDGYGVPDSLPVPASVDQLVQKYGRSSGLTRGYVSGVEATVSVTYGARTAVFSNQIIVSAGPGFIQSGDSGALLVADQSLPSPVGLLFAGSEDGSTAIASPIGAVLQAFDVTIDGQ